MIVDKYDIPAEDIKLFQNINNNQILAVTVKKGYVEKSKYPPKWEEARQKELDSLRKFNVFKVVGRQVVPKDHPTLLGVDGCILSKTTRLTNIKKIIQKPKKELGTKLG